MTDDELFARVIDKLNKINDELMEHGKVLVLQESNLKEHMRRTSAAEKSIEILESSLNSGLEKLVVAILPLQRHVAGVDVILKLCGGIAAFAAFILVVIEIILKVTHL
jgi:hypothetical protein